MSDQRQIAYWLLTCCILVFAMVILGGVTRLTGSGLSMVEWKPVYGILPPLNDGDWQELFEKYQQTPEYKHVNLGMDVEGFKNIFWLEYLHRILGRIIGLAFFLPLLYFWLRNKIPVGLKPKLVVMFILGGLQGLLGWYMVKSGLVDKPSVSQYRLTAHLLLAVFVYGYMLWVALGLLGVGQLRAIGNKGLFGLAIVILLFTSITLTSGGFVAGLHAGMSYNTFPLMAGQWVPEGLFNLSPWYRNLFENVVTVQFNHRLLAISTAVLVVLLWLFTQGRNLSTTTRYLLHALLVMVFIQVSLGISTLLMHVPIYLASAHQGGALLLLTISLSLIRQWHDDKPR